MKFLVLVLCYLVQLLLAESKVMPNRLPQPCPKSVSNYSECTYNVLKKMGPHLLKGVRELNFPKLTPLDIPLFVVNRTLINFVSIDIVMKNLHVLGFDQAQLKHFKFDPQNLHGELRISIPYLLISSEFEASGQLPEFVYDNAGNFKGNFTNLDVLFNFSLKEVDKLGVKYYSFENFKAKGTVGDGGFKVILKNPEGQAILHELVNYSNRNFPTVFNAVQPIHDEALIVFYKFLADQVLNTVPAKELIPE